ncbi:hypothetical protein FQN54_008448 [Arachnomyces sp. PD_36]|nr:hypothetical protein FQN54_008448 [Arachnomyces sp. PD_36]
MAKRRTKKRTHLRAENPNHGVSKNSAASMNRSPKTMVIRAGAGDVGPSVSQLVKDVRSMMEPDTASRLKERKSNKLKDYTTMAGPLGVTHLLLFSKSSTGNTNMRLALTPRGPTLHFKVENYSLCKDVTKISKHVGAGPKGHLNPPLLVMNNFSTVTSDEPVNGITKHLESLTTTVFQSLFPPISPQTTPLSSIRRIMLLNREVSPDGENDGSYIINLRHYAITTKQTGVPRRIRRLNPAEQRSKDKKTKSIPNLGKLDDVADYLLDPSGAGYTSASETEVDTDAEVEVSGTTARRVLNKREMQQMKSGEKVPKKKSSAPGVEKRAVKLVELGPRMRLRMMKVEEGLCEGRVMWHDFMTKSNVEIQKMDQTWDKKRKEKEERKKIQKENVERKKQEKAAAKKANGGGEEEDEDEDEDMEDEWDSDDFDEMEE